MIPIFNKYLRNVWNCWLLYCPWTGRLPITLVKAEKKGGGKGPPLRLYMCSSSSSGGFSLTVIPTVSWLVGKLGNAVFAKFLSPVKTPVVGPGRGGEPPVKFAARVNCHWPGTPKTMLGIVTSGHKTPRRTFLVYHNHQDNGEDERWCHFERDHSQAVVWSATNTPSSTVTGRRTLHDDSICSTSLEVETKAAKHTYEAPKADQKCSLQALITRK